MHGNGAEAQKLRLEELWLWSAKEVMLAKIENILLP
jgi:hypothetical protein